MSEPVFTLEPNTPKRPHARTRRGGWVWGECETAKLRCLSFGGGVQSSTLVYMMIEGALPWVDAIIYADTGDDGDVTDAHVVRVESLVRQASNACRFLRVSRGESISEVLAQRAAGDASRFVAPPVYLSNGAQGRRQCTREFKIEPLEKAQRELMGYKPRQLIPPGSAEVWIGISTDEVVRAGAAFTRWAVNRYPLLEMRMDRNDCIKWMERHGYAVPPKSACVFCPYRSDSSWRDLKAIDPAGFAKAVAVDEMLRAVPMMRNKAFVHRSRKPLADVDLSTAEERGQLDMINVCDAGCGL